jgi:hypothetical protein
MKAKVAAAAGLVVLVIVAGWFVRAWREEDAARARAARDASLALAAQLSQLSNKVDRLELSLLSARADTPSTCEHQEAKPIHAVAAPQVEPSVAAPPAAPEADESFAAAVQEIEDAIRRGRWSTADGLRFEATTASLSTELREQALARLSQAINAGRLVHESGAFPF